MSGRVYDVMRVHGLACDWWHDPLVKRLVVIVTSVINSEEYLHLILRHLYTRWRELRISTDMLLDLTLGRFEGLTIFIPDKTQHCQELRKINSQLRSYWVPTYKRVQADLLFD